jgi:hypothetical protein
MAEFRLGCYIQGELLLTEFVGTWEKDLLKNIATLRKIVSKDIEIKSRNRKFPVKKRTKRVNVLKIYPDFSEVIIGHFSNEKKIPMLWIQNR